MVSSFSSLNWIAFLYISVNTINPIPKKKNTIAMIAINIGYTINVSIHSVFESNIMVLIK